MKNEFCIRLVTEIMGTKVMTPEGENIGTIQNIFVEPQSRMILYVVLCYANFLGKTHRYYAIPCSQLKSGPAGDNSLILDIRRNELLDAQIFPQGEWSFSALKNIEHRVYELYKWEGKGKELMAS